jgi:hypothetical protein
MAVLVGIVVAFGLSGAASMQIPDEVAARRIVVVDPTTNKERIILALNKDRNAGILLNDQNGSYHIFLDTDTKGENSNIMFYDIDGKQKVVLGVTKDNQGLNVNGKSFP